MKKVLLSFLYICTLIVTAQSQTVNIPDFVFENKLVQLGIDSDGLTNGQILASDALNVTYLDVSTQTGTANISDMTGINAFVNLDTLLCNFNTIDSLNLSGLINLEHLECAKNYSIRKLILPPSPVLESIICGSNDIVELDLSNLPALRYINAFPNHIDSLDLSNHNFIEEVNFSTNNLVYADLSNTPNLNYLALSGNGLLSLNVSNTPSLKLLHLNNSNNIGAIDLSSSPALEELSISNCGLTQLDLSNNPNLKKLIGNSNPLTRIDFQNNTLIKEIILYDTSVDTLLLLTNSELKRLDVGRSNLRYIDVSQVDSLDYLSVFENQLTNLDISHNQYLKVLNCQYNQLTDIDVSNNVYLEEFAAGYNELTQLDFSPNPNLTEVYCTNNLLSKVDLSTNTLIYRVNLEDNLPFLQICVPSLGLITLAWDKDPSAVYDEGCFRQAVQGALRIDANNNCIVDSNEVGLASQIIQFKKGLSEYHYTTFDSTGNYVAYLDTGTYTATVIPSSPYWQACPSSQQIIVDTNYVIQTVNWTLQPIVSCPLLQVDLSAPFLRMTGGGSAYTVNYCNNGTIAASNATVDIDFDPYLNIVSSSIPIANQNGTIYTFNIGNVNIGDCGSFSVNVIVDTSAFFEQTHCTEAHGYPDSICIPNFWTGPIVTGSLDCQMDTVSIHLENIGAPMVHPHTFTIIEDDIAMRTGTINLGAGQSTTIQQFASQGKTYRIEVEQENNFPPLLGDSIFSLAIEGCNPLPNGSFNTGYVTMFSNGNSAPSIAVDCQQNIASYDPNDKSAQPLGYGSSHYIKKNTAIDYKVRFQNTGTDTAFNIVIIDTISPFLDVTSIQMGASSHSYTWEINNDILKVSFPNILLVDSNANEPLSHGFFRYRIEQEKDNPLGSLIENQAAIYFDYNPPIFTNTTFHTIGENFINSIIVSSDIIHKESVDVIVFPNPFKNYTTLKIEGSPYRNLSLRVVDITGRTLLSKSKQHSNQVRLSRDDLPTGIYIYQLWGDGDLINTGKIIAQ